MSASAAAAISAERLEIPQASPASAHEARACETRTTVPPQSRQNNYPEDQGSFQTRREETVPRPCDTLAAMPQDHIPGVLEGKRTGSKAA